MGFNLPNFEAVEKKTPGRDAILSKTPFSQNVKLVSGFVQPNKGMICLDLCIHIWRHTQTHTHVRMHLKIIFGLQRNMPFSSICHVYLANPETWHEREKHRAFHWVMNSTAMSQAGPRLLSFASFYSYSPSLRSGPLLLFWLWNWERR